MRRLLALFFLLTLSASAQQAGGTAKIGGAAAVGGGTGAVLTNTFTLIQANFGSLVTSGGTYTPTSTIGTGHAVIIGSSSDTSSGTALTAITGGCSVSWQFPVGAQAGSGGQSISFAICTSSSSAASVTLTTGNGGSIRPFIYEYSFTQASCSIDGTGAAANVSSGGNLAGATISGTTGTSDVVVQGQVGSGATSINAPFGNFTATGSQSAADVENTASPGTAPTWTGATGTVPVGGVALK